ncbi:hypothetical protein PAMC26577_14320 [Caballeronia sordidicola]|uniref:Uncharacterized protein n=1 Tax=Caballeronia sordidicola TaxID=196367 RepID=A0A242MTX1_CABSO|nr:hypothetical protein PAMC26577_14320 [Caballeronia sordidicola]
MRARSYVQSCAVASERVLEAGAQLKLATADSLPKVILATQGRAR